MIKKGNTTVGQGGKGKTQPDQSHSLTDGTFLLWNEDQRDEGNGRRLKNAIGLIGCVFPFLKKGNVSNIKGGLRDSSFATLPMKEHVSKSRPVLILDTLIC